MFTKELFDLQSSQLPIKLNSLTLYSQLAYTAFSTLCLLLDLRRTVIDN